MSYIHDLVDCAAKFGFMVFIDPHQDVWSRFTGGDGAPMWTMELLGMQLGNLAETGMAVRHPDYSKEYPVMLWTTNYMKYVTNTMFTLFFAGNDFAPKTKICEESAQDFLQGHYINAFCVLASTLSDLDNVVGFDVFNEPWHGYIGWKDLSRNGKPHLGRYFHLTPTPFEAMQLSEGISKRVDFWGASIFGPIYHGKRKVNKHKQRLWLDGYECIWKQNGVWELDGSGRVRLIKPDYFYVQNGKPVSFQQSYLMPFVKHFGNKIREYIPNALIFMWGCYEFYKPYMEAISPLTCLNSTKFIVLIVN